MKVSKYLHFTHLGMVWRRISLFLIALFAVIGLQHFVVEPSFSASSSLSNTIASSSSITKNNSDHLIAQDSNVDSPNLRTYDSLSEEEKALFSKIILFVSIFGLVVYVFSCFCMMKIADKLEIPNSWLAWIPIAQIWVMVRAAGKPGWWLILFFVPFVNFVISLIVLFTIPTSLGKSSLYGLLPFIPVLGVFLYFGLLAFT